MRQMKRFVGGWPIVLGLSFVLGAAAAQAAGPREDTGKRDVIADAAPICAASGDANVQAACQLLDATNGAQDTTTAGCTKSFDGTDNGIVDYLLRNCDKNEEALLRSAASAVLSLDDFANGKLQQDETAAGYLCRYADKFMLLQATGKLIATRNLADDALDIVIDDLGLTCE
jgi:hypothetical protein